MPAIVIGADTPTGAAIVAALDPRSREVRAFVSDPGKGAALRRAGAKVALGDVSDSSHVAAATAGAFSAIVVAGAAADERERAFAADPSAAVAALAVGIREASVQRVIWVEDDRVAPPAGLLEGLAPETVAVVSTGRKAPDIAADVAALDDLAAL